MSTNFYFKPTEGPLTAFAGLHLGRRSGDWQFSFQAYVEEGGKRRISLHNADLSIEIEIPRLVIRSWQDWKALLRATPGEIRNEYGVLYTVEEFEEEIRQHSPCALGEDDQPLGSPYDAMVTRLARLNKVVDPERNWKDAQGFSFSNYDFS